MEDLKAKMKFAVTLDLYGYISKKNYKESVDKDEVIEIGAYVFVHFLHSIKKDNGKITKEEVEALISIINEFYLESFKNQFTNEDLKIIIQKGTKLFNIDNSFNVVNFYLSNILGINEKFIRDYIIDDTEVKIELDLEKETNKVILDMSFLKEGLKQTIITSELEEDLKILIPNEVGEDDIFEENLLYAVMLEQLKKVIDIHIEKFGRLLQNDLVTYVIEVIIIMEAYKTQVLEEDFEIEKKETFQSLFNFYYSQLPNEWK